MTPAELAEMEAICFPNASVHWSENDYAAHIKNSFGVTISSDAGFVVGRVTADEAEIINLGVLPDCRQEGHGTDLLAQFEKEVLASGAEMILLEVSAEPCIIKTKYPFGPIGLNDLKGFGPSLAL